MTIYYYNEECDIKMKVKIAELNKTIREIRRDINYNINEKHYEELLDSFNEYDDLVDQLVDKLKIYKYKNKNLKNKLEKFKASDNQLTEPSVVVSNSTADMIDVTSTSEYQELLAKYNSLLEENKKLKTENASKGVGKDIAEENRLRKMIGEKDKQVHELMAYIKELEEKIPKPDPNLLQIR